jgi:uncharacterized protein (TIGR02246 family)
MGIREFGGGLMSSSSGVDEAAVRAVEAAYDAAWQAGDIESLLACLSEDAVLINPRGEMARGHDEIRRELAAVLGGPARGSKHTSLISQVEFITADVAIVDGQAMIEPAGQDEPASALAHRFTDILIRKNRVWLIAHIRACAATTTTVSDPI